jgi:hypothetical protein
MPASGGCGYGGGNCGKCCCLDCGPEVRLPQLLTVKDYVKEMGEFEKQAVRSTLIVLLQHLLSRDYATGMVLRYNLPGWDDEIAEFRSRLLKLIGNRSGLKAVLTNTDLSKA